jgi:hypothetical protein
MRIETFHKNEKGSATIIALLVMLLLLAFVALAVSRTTSETLATGNDETESRTFAASQACLENATREFDQIFELKLSPSATDLDNVRNSHPTGFDDFDFPPTEIIQTAQPYNTSAGSFLQGLTALRDEWKVNCVVTHKATGVQVALSRSFFNDRVPIFQFGIFYNDDLEFHPGPRFDFGGRVHSNGSLFLMATTGLYFSSKVSAANEILTDVARNNHSSDEWGNNVFVRNGSGAYVQLGRTGGSVLHSVTNGANVFATTPPGQLPMPSAYINSNWPTIRESFQGNLLSNSKRLDLPLKISSTVAGAPLDYIELIKRGKTINDKYKSGGTNLLPVISTVPAGTADGAITTKERYTNKTGIRITLANYRDELPGCAAAANDNSGNNQNRCGVRLDGPTDGKCHGAGRACDAAPATGAGYIPKGTAGSTQINGMRFNYPYDNSKASWIKIETMQINTDGDVVTQDITEDILALGVTEKAPVYPAGGTCASTAVFFPGTCASPYATNADKYSIVKMQRFVMPGVDIRADGDTRYMTAYSNSGPYNVIQASNSFTGANPSGSDDATVDYVNPGTTTKDSVFLTCSLRNASGGAQTKRNVAPFPLKMFDTREGLFNDSMTINSSFNYNATTHPYHDLAANGVMGIIDIDVANLRLFLNGDATLGNLLPANGTKFSDAAGRRLSYTDIPDSNGWVVYLSDRRGDYDFDGEYDMEDIYGQNGTLDPGEDVNVNGVLDVNIGTGVNNEAPPANQFISPEVAATTDTQWYRRGVRLINASVVPGKYDSATPANTKGFTFASENGVYVQGNFNATGVSSIDSPTDPDDYLPHDTVNHIPSSIVGDSITILSNNWNDSISFRYPYTLSQRQASDTVDRFAMLSGDGISSLDATPNQGGGDPRLSGGVHNFKRFLEDWSGNTLSYSGSLINLYNSHNNNGAFKCCTNVYGPPNRNWTFDVSFMDPTRLPPGTPFFQSIQLTGFQRLNE